MTVKKATRCGGFAAVVARQRLHSAQQLDITTIKTLHQPYNIVVSFNDKDQLQLATKREPSDDDKKLKQFEAKTLKQDHISIDDIDNCVNIENYPNCGNTLVFYATKNGIKEAIALKFENEQDFKRIYFTYKYFKMRNSLTKKPNYVSNENIFPKKKYDVKKIKNIDEFNNNYDKGIEFDLLKTDNDGVTHISVQQKNYRYDQPLSLIGIRSDMTDFGEVDSIIHPELDIPVKANKKRLQYKKPKAPPPPKDPPKVLAGEFVRVNIDRAPDIIPKENIKLSKVPDILLFRDTKLKRNNVTSNLWSNNNKVSGYESDREEWRNSRSQFSTTAFDSLARPTRAAMALTMRKPRLPDPLHYYRIQNERPQLTQLSYRPNTLSRPPVLPRPTEIKRNFNTDRRFQSLQNLDTPKPIEPKKHEAKKNSNISNRITGITNKLRDLGRPTTLGRFKAQSHGDVSLKPVLKSQDCAKRSVVRTCSAEPPKKVTFSAFATVQVV